MLGDTLRPLLQRGVRFTHQAGDRWMPIPVMLIGLDSLMAQGATMKFIGVGDVGKTIADSWVVVILPPESDQCYTLVARHLPKVRTLKGKPAVERLIARYPHLQEIQALLLPLRPSLQQADDVFLLSRSEIEALDIPPSFVRQDLPRDS